MQSSNRKTVVTKYCTLINKLLLTLVFIVVQKVLLWGDMFAAHSCWSRIKWPRQWFHFSKVYCKIKSTASKYPDKHRALTYLYWFTYLVLKLHSAVLSLTENKYNTGLFKDHKRQLICLTYIFCIYMHGSVGMKWIPECSQIFRIVITSVSHHYTILN